jgi:adenylylsulfate kinase-like enzyme
VLDDQSLRAGLNSDLGNAAADHAEMLRRTAELAAYLAHSGVIAIVVASTPAATDRARAREIGGKGFYEVHVDAAIGTDPAFEPPGAPDLRLDMDRYDLKSSALQVEQLLETAGVIHSNDQPPGGEFAI